MPAIKVKKGGVYADPVGIFAKKAGVYSAVTGVSAKVAGAYVAVAGGGAPVSLPINSTLVTIGDSITALSFTQNAANARYYSAGGRVWWFLAGIQHRLRIPQFGNLAVSGMNLSQIDAAITNGISPQFVPMASLNPAVVMFMGGTNDLGAATAGNVATVFANMTASFNSILAKIFATGAKCKLTGILPNSTVTSPLTGVQEQLRLDINAWLAAKAAADPTRINYTNPDTLGFTNADLADNVHPNRAGCFKVGTQEAADFNSWLASGFISDVAPLALYTNNPTMSGGPNPPTGWTVNTSAAGGATVTLSKDGGGRQRVQLSGTASGTTRKLVFDQTVNNGSLGYPSVGDKLELIADFEIVGTTINVTDIIPIFWFGTNSFNTYAQGWGALQGPGEALTFPLTGRVVLRTPCVIAAAAAGTPNYIQNQLEVVLRDNAGATVTALDLRINYIGFRKIG